MRANEHSIQSARNQHLPLRGVCSFGKVNFVLRQYLKEKVKMNAKLILLFHKFTQNILLNLTALHKLTDFPLHLCTSHTWALSTCNPLNLPSLVRNIPKLPPNFLHYPYQRGDKHRERMALWVRLYALEVFLNSYNVRCPVTILVGVWLSSNLRLAAAIQAMFFSEKILCAQSIFIIFLTRSCSQPCAAM